MRYVAAASSSSFGSPSRGDSEPRPGACCVADQCRLWLLRVYDRNQYHQPDRKSGRTVRALVLISMGRASLPLRGNGAWSAASCRRAARVEVCHVGALAAELFSLSQDGPESRRRPLTGLHNHSTPPPTKPAPNLLPARTAQRQAPQLARKGSVMAAQMTPHTSRCAPGSILGRLHGPHAPMDDSATAVLGAPFRPGIRPARPPTCTAFTQVGRWRTWCATRGTGCWWRRRSPSRSWSPIGYDVFGVNIPVPFGLRVWSLQLSRSSSTPLSLPTAWCSPGGGHKGLGDHPLGRRSSTMTGHRAGYGDRWPMMGQA